MLSSYAVAANYFTGLPGEVFFEDYCRHFGIVFLSAENAEELYVPHFVREYHTRGCEGYKVIIDLHNQSETKSFKRCREVFAAKFIGDTCSQEKDILTNLREEALLNVTFEVGSGFCHSVTVWCDGSVLYCRDTNFRGTRIISGLKDLGKLRDSVLYQKK